MDRGPTRPQNGRARDRSGRLAGTAGCACCPRLGHERHLPPRLACATISEWRPAAAGWQCGGRQPQIRRGVAQSGSAPALGAGGRRFESSRPDQTRPCGRECRMQNAKCRKENAARAQSRTFLHSAFCLLHSARSAVSRPRSSAGQSNSLLSCGSQVRALPGTPPALRLPWPETRSSPTAPVPPLLPRDTPLRGSARPRFPATLHRCERRRGCECRTRFARAW